MNAPAFRPRTSPEHAHLVLSHLPGGEGDEWATFEQLLDACRPSLDKAHLDAALIYLRKSGSLIRRRDPDTPSRYRRTPTGTTRLQQGVAR